MFSKHFIRSAVAFTCLLAAAPAVAQSETAEPAPSPAAEAEIEAFSSGETTTLRERAGAETKVYGVISNVGALTDNRITFLNFRGNPRGGFVGIVYASDREAVMEGLGIASFDELIGKTIELTGLITLHRDSPQIEIKSAGQIRLTD